MSQEGHHEKHTRIWKELNNADTNISLFAFCGKKDKTALQMEGNSVKIQTVYLMDTILHRQHYSKKNVLFWDVTPCGSCYEPTFRRNVLPSSSG
jgi:hypothetical protein